jgi:hypothetical protein
MGMGGFVTCIKDAGFANPAFAGTLTERASVARVALTDFEQGLDLRGEQLSVAFPLQPDRQGLQVTGFSLRTRRTGLMTTAKGPVLVSLREDDAAVHYGRRLGRQWDAGIGLSPILRTDTDLRNPATGDLLAHLHSKAKYGCRLGGVYQFSEEGCAGFVYDYYREDVTGSGLPFGAGASPRFTSKEMAVGVSRRLGDRVLGAVEWQQLSTEGQGARQGARQGDSGFRGGLEVRPSPQWAVRVGDNDGAFSAGLGLQSQAWSVEYAYVKDWNADSVGNLLGDSRTHSLEVRYTW